MTVRYLVEFDDPAGLLALESMMLPVDYIRKSPIPGLPGHPKYGMIFHFNSMKQAHEMEKKLKMSVFDPYSFTLNRI